MKTARISLALLLLVVLSPVVSSAQANYTEEGVYRVTLLDIKPGKGPDFWKDLRQNVKPVYDEYKKQGIIKDYKIQLKMSTDNPADWDIAIMLQYKNMAALDGLSARTDPITGKLYGSPEARQVAATKRSEYATIVAQYLTREITLNDSELAQKPPSR